MRSWTALPLMLLLLPACCVAPEDEGECSHEDLCGGRHSAEPVRSGCLLQHNYSQHTVLKLDPEDELHEDAVSTRRIDAAKLHALDGTLSALAGASGAVGKIGRTSADSDGDARSAGPALVEGAVSAAARRAAEPSAAASETALVSFALAGASGAVGKIGRTSADSDGDARSAGPALVEGAVSAAARRAAEPSAAASETALVSLALPFSLEAGQAHPGDLVLQGLDEFLGLPADVEDVELAAAAELGWRMAEGAAAAAAGLKAWAAVTVSRLGVDDPQGAPL
eukprot:CAMPEP_0183605692 /NCGR_PEP_ID=MMETSP0371-20130417/182582_1 /TAXON_ID=268820 /ORGANISM="Peridinium aciculiferum, Strain PAER-2" /LENGTH=281 /DNA_ID=CAMNT_0025817803 /DNA_START=68 /DNA_END=911 /DNA_ORIENTATION=+